MVRSGDVHARLAHAIARHAPGAEIPKKWEKFADVALLPQSALTGLDRGEAELWSAVAEALNVSRIGRRGEVQGPFRQPTVELLLGEDDWVVRREHGLSFGYPFTKCMWSAGNVTERGRLAGLDLSGEKVLDLYAGIGYYTLPLLGEGARGPNGEPGPGKGAAQVVACEWNPDAAASLRWSLEKNGFQDRCTVLEGDNQSTLKANDGEHLGTFDRVNLGLLPSAEAGFELALAALKPEGGILHIHGVAPGGEEEAWAAEIANQLGGTITAIQRVKWYAPHWRHVVVNLRIVGSHPGVHS